MQHLYSSQDNKQAHGHRQSCISKKLASFSSTRQEDLLATKVRSDLAKEVEAAWVGGLLVCVNQVEGQLPLAVQGQAAVVLPIFFCLHL